MSSGRSGRKTALEHFPCGTYNEAGESGRRSPLPGIYRRIIKTGEFEHEDHSKLYR